MPHDVFGIVATAVRYTESMGALGDLIDDLARDARFLADVRMGDTIGMHFPSRCSHTDTVIDAECLSSGLLQCSTLPKGQFSHKKLGSNSHWQRPDWCVDNSDELMADSELKVGGPNVHQSTGMWSSCADLSMKFVAGKRSSWTHRPVRAVG